jgi:hypothetical protein
VSFSNADYPAGATIKLLGFWQDLTTGEKLYSFKIQSLLVIRHSPNCRNFAGQFKKDGS